MPKIILIKHASPQVDPAVPSDQWRLSERGRASCVKLAELVRPHVPTAIVSSEEPKAVETAELVAQKLSIPHRSAPNLHEHDRRNVPHMRSSEFISMVEVFFRKPDELVLGRETARQALDRFNSDLEDVIRQNPADSIAVVTHGTVLALFLAEKTNRPGFELWRQLGLPSFAVLELPDYRVVETVAQVA
jgi:broad specificity phosphatase PhoE